MNAVHQAKREAKRLARLKHAHIEHVKQGHITLRDGKAVIQTRDTSAVDHIRNILHGLKWAGPIVTQ